MELVRTAPAKTIMMKKRIVFAFMDIPLLSIHVQSGPHDRVILPDSVLENFSIRHPIIAAFGTLLS
jgi:hypothetical protein